MKNSWLEKDNKNIQINIIKNVRNLVRLKKEIIESTIKHKTNRFRLKKENEAIKDRVIRDNRNLFEHGKEEYYYKPARAGNFWSNTYIECEKNGDKKKPLYVEEYFNKIRP